MMCFRFFRSHRTGGSQEEKRLVETPTVQFAPRIVVYDTVSIPRTSISLPNRLSIRAVNHVSATTEPMPIVNSVHCKKARTQQESSSYRPASTSEYKPSARQSISATPSSTSSYGHNGSHGSEAFHCNQSATSKKQNYYDNQRSGNVISLAQAGYGLAKPHRRQGSEIKSIIEGTCCDVRATSSFKNRRVEEPLRKSARRSLIEELTQYGMRNSFDPSIVQLPQLKTGKPQRNRHGSETIRVGNRNAQRSRAANHDQHSSASHRQHADNVGGFRQDVDWSWYSTTEIERTCARTKTKGNETQELREGTTSGLHFKQATLNILKRMSRTRSTLR